MLSCCGLGPRDGPGTLSGHTVKIKENFRGKHLITIFEERLKKKKIAGKKTAVQYQDRSALSYSELNTFASCLARSMIERLGYDFKMENPDNDMIIAVCLPMSEKAIALVLGILKTGCAYLPLDSWFPENLLLDIIETFKPIMLITDDNGKIFNKFHTESFSSVCKLFTVEELWIDIEFPADRLSKRPSSNRAWEIEFLENRKTLDIPLVELPMVVFYSRGLCKNVAGVRLSTRCVINLILHHWKKIGQFEYSRKDSCCVTVSLADSLSLPQIFIPLLCGCTIHLFRRLELLNTDNFVKNLSWRLITKLSIESYLLGAILESIDFLGESTIKLLKLRIVTCRGGFVPYDTAKVFFSIFKHGVTLVNCLGGTEVCGEIALEQYQSLKDYESKLVNGKPTIGTVVDNVKIYVLDEDMNLVPDGTKGEIYISGDCLAVGYVNEKERGENEITKFMPNPFTEHPKYNRLFKTGEYAHIQKVLNGRRRLFVYGRQGALVRVQNNIFSTDDVTLFVKNLDGVKDAFVCPYHADRIDQLLVAFIKLKPEVAEDPNLGADFDFTLRSQLPVWAIPDEFKVFPGCLPECKKKESLCRECCLKIFEHDLEEKMRLEREREEIRNTAETSNQFG